MQFFQGKETEWIEPGELGARVFQAILDSSPTSTTRRIEHDADEHAAPGGPHQGIDEAVTDLAVLEDVSFEVDAGPGAWSMADSIGGKGLIAVVQGGVGIPHQDGGADERSDVIGKLRVAGRDRTLDAQGRGILREVDQDGDDPEANADPGQRLPVLRPGVLPAILHASSL